MSFDPATLVVVADFLRANAGAEGCPQEAALRVAIGRYYYAALLAARGYLSRSSPIPENTDATTHRWVINGLRESSDSAAQQLGVALNTMRADRNAADYGDEIPRLAEAVDRSAKACSRALKWVSVLETRYPR